MISTMPRKKPVISRLRTLAAVELRQGSRAQPHARRRRTRAATLARALRDQGQ